MRDQILDLLAGRAPRPFSRLPKLLRDYPPYETPFPGSGRMLKPAQAQANLDYLEREKARRLQVVGELMGRFGVDLPAALGGGDARTFVTGVLRWVARDWPSIHDKAAKSHTAWRDGPHGRTPIYSLIMDTALALGEVIARGNPDYGWALAATPNDRGTAAWRRPCLIRPAEGDIPADVQDLEVRVFDWYVESWPESYWFRRQLPRTAEHLLEVIGGGHVERWRQINSHVLSPQQIAEIEEGADGCIAYQGLRWTLKSAEVAAVQAGEDARVAAAVGVGLSHRLVEPGEGAPAVLLIGRELAELGVRGVNDLGLAPAKASKAAAEVRDLLAQAGLAGESGLILQYESRRDQRVGRR